jgi:glucose/arabinose dehydrogenase
MCRFRWAALAAAAALLLYAPAAAGAVTYPQGFEEQIIAAGLSAPTGMAWAPDGRMFVIEKEGRLKVVPPGGSTATLVPGGDISSEVNSYWDRGLLGIAVDTSYAMNNYVYLLYTRERQPLTPDGDGQMVSRLERFRITPSNQITERKVLLGTHQGPCPPPSNTVDCIPSEGASHSIGSVRSAPDGTLWVGSGDASSFNYVDELALRTYDVQSMAGKILHVDREGRGVPGHPFCPANPLTDVCAKVWAGGFRNPFRFKLRPGGGLTVGDVGWGTTEEIDLVPTAAGGGRMYGWPCYEGQEPTGGYRDLDECDPEYAKEGTAQAHLGPAHTYPHVANIGGSVMGGPTYSGPYPQDYQGDIFFGDYVQGFIRRLRPSSQGPSTVQDFATGWTGVDLELTPGGNLAYASVGNFTDGDGSIKQIVYTPGNRSPVASIQPEDPSGAAPFTVSFDGRGSSDPDDDALSYHWQFGDGETSTLPAPSHTYDAGLYTARLTVSDGRGSSNSTTVEVSSGNTPPQPSVSGDSTYRGGKPFRLRASASDEQDGDLPAGAFSWDVRVVHAQHVHTVGSYGGRSELTLDAITDHDADAHYEVIMTARDSDGLTAQRTVELHPEKTRVRLNSSPPGATVSYGGREFKAPRELVTAVGYETTVSASDPFELGGAIFGFTGWSNGGARVQDFAVPPGGAELTANYVRRGGAPSSPGPSTPPIADGKGPALRLVAVNAARGRIRGVVSDPSGVAAVQVALRARQQRQRCRWWLAGRRKLSASLRRCDRPRWLGARLAATSGNARWLAVLGRRLPPGSYRVLVRARDTAGNVSQPALGRASLVRVRAGGKRPGPDRESARR